MKIRTPHTEDIPELKALWKEAFFDTDEYIDVFFDTAYSESRCLIAEENGVAAMLYWFDASYLDTRVAYFYAIATKITHRGKGICARLMDEAHKRLKDLGYSYAMLVPGSKGLFDFYKKLGYEISTYIDTIECDAKEGKIEIREISGEEYAALRRKYLPENSVIQENENIKYLEKQSNLYTGKDFLLSCRVNNGALFGIELLGNKEKAPLILNALSCKTGTFRISGEKTPFSMCFPLENQTRPPIFYFGLAFD